MKNRGQKLQMRRATAVRSSTVPTKERILDAAIRRFARYSYEDTGLRDIAADAQVDVAYVHRSFGSKERLFAEAVRATVRADRLLLVGKGDQAAHLARQVFLRDNRSQGAEIGPLDIVIRSLSSPAAATVLREFILEDFINPLSKDLDDPAEIRAALIGALLTGLGILRNVLEIKALRETAGGSLEDLLRSTLAHIGSAGLKTKSRISERPR